MAIFSQMIPSGDPAAITGLENNFFAKFIFTVGQLLIDPFLFPTDGGRNNTCFGKENEYFVGSFSKRVFNAREKFFHGIICNQQAIVCVPERKTVLHGIDGQSQLLPDDLVFVIPLFMELILEDFY